MSKPKTVNVTAVVATTSLDKFHNKFTAEGLQKLADRNPRLTFNTKTGQLTYAGPVSRIPVIVEGGC